ncbi:hypothetical protein N7457_009278 [Penicillium paradoxum]|uniref:uncharacterized protein n=1 Tax=Penicillium paradoxum TaxID=176176 RepID=UPI002546EE0C|nr:uncharacterized protein N7457_009278 [Penicillium paradoxum]KAJ5774382.1 hypothetical protein N7457_009278 [Penicillium paradoxum]
MSVRTAPIETIVVDSVSLLSSVLDDLSDLPNTPPPLYIDLEGVNLGRHGSISILSIYALPNRKVYLIDVHKLGNEAFSTTSTRGKSLKYILESPAILKGIFDVRNDSDAMYSHYGISVDGIRDIQLMELGTRTGSKEFIAGLAKCVERESPISGPEKAIWKHTKESVRRLYDPKVGGRYEVFNERPFKPEIIKYCAQDVTLLPGLYAKYHAKLCRPGEGFWESEVLIATKKRIELSQSPNYNGHTRENARGPWSRDYIAQAIDEWNMDIVEAVAW